MAWRRFPGGRSGRRQRSATGDRPSTVDAMAYPGESALVLTAAPPPSVTGYLLDDSSPRSGQADGQVLVGMLRNRLPTAPLVWLAIAVSTRQHRPWVEWLKRGLLRLK